MTKLAMFAAASLLAAAPMTAPAAPGDEDEAGYLGVRMQRIEGGLAEALDMAPDSGVLVSQVVDDGPAAKAGLANGDIITKFGDASIGTPSDLHAAVRGAKAGDTVKVTYVRDGKSRSAEVALAAAPDRPGRPGRGPMLRERIGAEDDTRDRPRRDRARVHVPDIREMRLGRERGWLGVSTQPLGGELGEYFGAKDGGALVSEVVEGSPAQKLGLKAGDVIVKVDDASIEDPADLRRAIGAHEEPAEVEVTWLRDHKTRSGKVELEVREGFAWFGGEGRGMPDFDLNWTPEDRDEMRRRVNAFRMQADEGAQRAIDELREQVQKLQEKVEKLESR